MDGLPGRRGYLAPAAKLAAVAAHTALLGTWVRAAEAGERSPIMSEPRMNMPQPSDPIWLWYKGAYLPAVMDFTGGAGVVVQFSSGGFTTTQPFSVIHVPPQGRAGATFTAAEEVYIEWNGMFFDGTVRGPAGKAGHCRVHYDRTDASSEATVSAQRLRRRTPL